MIASMDDPTSMPTLGSVRAALGARAACAVSASPTAARAVTAWQRRRGPLAEAWRLASTRFREDRLGVTAGSLTFMTLIALVPLLTVMLAVFSVFPMFASFQGALERLLLQNLVPDAFARPVLSALTQFAAKASRIGTLGLAALLGTALALIFTIDRTLNAIWRVRRTRSFAQRLLVYWSALTLGPLLLGASLTLTSYALSASRGLVGAIPGGFGLLIDTVQFLLLAATATGLFRFVPNTDVRWAHATAGGLFVAVGIEVAKQALGWYVSVMPTFSSVYGAFAIVPILLLWVYLLWVVVLLGAVVAAYAPSLLQPWAPRVVGPGGRFALALELIGLLEAARRAPSQGLTATELAGALRLDLPDVEPLVDLLVGLGWVARLDEESPVRCVLLADPASTPAAPLADQLLLVPSAATQRFRREAALDRATLSQWLQDDRLGTP
jgi:membrane protein